MIEIRFSKTDSNVFEIDTDDKLERYYVPFLKSYNFQNISKNIWQNLDNDDQIIDIIYDLFNSSKFKIIPNPEIKKIYSKKTLN